MINSVTQCYRLFSLQERHFSPVDGVSHEFVPCAKGALLTVDTIFNNSAMKVSEIETFDTLDNFPDGRLKILYVPTYQN